MPCRVRRELPGQRLLCLSAPGVEYVQLGQWCPSGAWHLQMLRGCQGWATRPAQVATVEPITCSAPAKAW